MMTAERPPARSPSRCDQTTTGHRSLRARPGRRRPPRRSSSRVDALPHFQTWLLLIVLIASVMSLARASDVHHRSPAQRQQRHLLHKREAQARTTPIAATTDAGPVPTTTPNIAPTTAPATTTAVTTTPTTQPAATTNDDVTTTTKKKKAHSSDTTTAAAVATTTPTTTTTTPLSLAVAPSNTTAAAPLVVITVTSIVTNPDGSTSIAAVVNPAATADSATSRTTSGGSSASRTYAIIGGVLGSVVGLLLLLILLYKLAQHRGWGGDGRLGRFINEPFGAGPNGKEIKWPELQPDGQTVSTGLATLNPMGTRKTGGAGISMGEKDDEDEFLDNEEEELSGNGSWDEIKMPDGSIVRRPSTKCGGVGGAAIQRSVTGSMSSHYTVGGANGPGSRTSHYDSYRSPSPAMSFHRPQSPQILYPVNLHRAPSNPHLHGPYAMHPPPPAVLQSYPYPHPHPHAAQSALQRYRTLALAPVNHGPPAAPPSQPRPRSLMHRPSSISLFPLSTSPAPPSPLPSPSPTSGGSHSSHHYPSSPRMEQGSVHPDRSNSNSSNSSHGSSSSSSAARRKQQQQQQRYQQQKEPAFLGHGQGFSADLYAPREGVQRQLSVRNV
ncbi:BZ3500_MvSof-1268-A1-R1_Chr11-1g03233 [Microbotryum saponariae]|uniref:BZ3500_MvSof-1268-A1-R1_Chr11-1g03233 protein n=1 Tax=Microbotryum saponariae TaxID=289078 RepID=A0A2X0LWI8_9BASI|nr:BZ3501_MvSof-1269-A2-R1_Chr11g02808 [Microbotryum saponariae]SDA03793.1 BZ3500_MvSof-1268-A1-R1_Chr11-1g03233 [Microbotryum saponariae]